MNNNAMYNNFAQTSIVKRLLFQLFLEKNLFAPVGANFSKRVRKTSTFHDAGAEGAEGSQPRMKEYSYNSMHKWDSIQTQKPFLF